MSVIDSRAKLVMATKKMMSQWQQVREAWRDENARHFEQRYMAPLETNIRSALLAMERMNHALDSAQNDCKDDTRSGL